MPSTAIAHRWGAQFALYVHVDVGCIIGGASYRTVVNRTMHHCADSLEAVGFQVTERLQDEEHDIIVGYAVLRKPARIRFPATLCACLCESLRFVVSLAWCIQG